MKRYAMISGILLVAGVAGYLAWAQVADAPAADYYDIGDFHCEVTTDSPTAQLWFDRGLAMCFGFNHEEAVRCFEQALAADPGMPMALWGMAYARGPNINNMEIVPEQIAQAALAVHLAELHAGEATELERDLIAALADALCGARAGTRRPRSAQPGVCRGDAEGVPGASRERAGDGVVRGVADEPGAVAALGAGRDAGRAHAGVDRSPGDRDLKNGPTIRCCVIYTFMRSRRRRRRRRRLAAANRLRDLLPGMGHLVHMPSHIDVLLGDYDAVIAANQRGIAADNEFLRNEGPLNFYTLYRVHNHHFLVYGAMFDGQSELALTTARKIPEQVPEEMLRQQTDFLDAFMPTPLHVLVRFGRWEEILKEPEPADYLPVSRSIWHYARGLAFAATGRVAQAEAEQRAFAEVAATVPETSFLFQNPSRSILSVAEAMLAGEIAYRRGEFDAAFAHLEEAVRRDDGLNYDEPWGWMQPAQSARWGLLLEQGRAAEAEAAYRADLDRHPNNPWALHGLAECLDRQGQAAAAADIRAKFKTATDDCDVTIDRSCFCRLGESQ